MDRRTLHLLYKHEDEIRHHWCSPSLGRAVRDYILSEYGKTPNKTMRRRTMQLDPGGAALVGEEVVNFPMDGWTAAVRLSVVSHVRAELLRRMEKPPKVYPGGLKAVRLGLRFFNAVMTPEEATALVGLMKSRVTDSLAAEMSFVAGLQGMSNVVAPKFPQQGEA